MQSLFYRISETGITFSRTTAFETFPPTKFGIMKLEAKGLFWSVKCGHSSCNTKMVLARALCV
jgi:hypothetical protein